MSRIAGIGGVFIHSQDPARLARWYRDVLGMPLTRLGKGVYHVDIQYRSHSRPEKVVHLAFAILPSDGALAKRRNQVTVNYRVDDLEDFCRRLRSKKVDVQPIFRGVDAEGTGSFTHIFDPEGNRLELWQPSSGA